MPSRFNHIIGNSIHIDDVKNLEDRLNSNEARITSLSNMLVKSVYGTIVFRKLNLARDYVSFISYVYDGAAHGGYNGRWYIGQPTRLTQLVVSIDNEGYTSWTSGSMLI